MTMQRYMQDQLSLKILDGSLKEGSRVVVDLNTNKEIVSRLVDKV